MHRKRKTHEYHHHYHHYHHHHHHQQHHRRHRQLNSSNLHQSATSANITPRYEVGDLFGTFGLSFSLDLMIFWYGFLWRKERQGGVASTSNALAGRWSHAHYCTMAPSSYVMQLSVSLFHAKLWLLAFFEQLPIRNHVSRFDGQRILRACNLMVCPKKKNCCQIYFLHGDSVTKTFWILSIPIWSPNFILCKLIHGLAWWPCARSAATPEVCFWAISTKNMGLTEESWVIRFRVMACS